MHYTDHLPDHDLLMPPIGRFQVAQILEGDPVSVGTPSDTDSLDSTNMVPAEELSLLGVSSSTNSPSSKSRQDVSD